MRRQLFAAVALAPLLAVSGFASAAYADTVVSADRTTPLVTSTDGAVTVDAGKSVTLATSLDIITVNSSSNVTNNGTLTTVDATDNVTGVNNVTAIRVTVPVTANLTNSGTINLGGTYVATDGTTDTDSEPDGPIAQGTGRFGVKVDAGASLIGTIKNGTSAVINVTGNDSAGISVSGAITGQTTFGKTNGIDDKVAILSQGQITVLGDNAIGIDINAPITGDLRVAGEASGRGVSVRGLNAMAISVDAPITGGIAIGGTVDSTGYRNTTDRSIPVSDLEPDDVLQGGPTVNIAANVTGGLLISASPALVAGDVDTDGVSDELQQTGRIVSTGAAPAVRIGAVGGPVTVGAVNAADTALNYGIVNLGAITGQGLLDGVSGTGVQIGVAGGDTVTIEGGFRNAGTIQGTAFVQSGIAVDIGAAATVPTFRNDATGLVSAAVQSATSQTATAIRVETGGSLTSLTNDGTIQSQAYGSSSNASAIVDMSGTLTSITNTGKIISGIAADSTSGVVNPITGVIVAIDVSQATKAVTVTQTDTLTTDVVVPQIIGAVRFGSGGDTFTVNGGTVNGDVTFGAGADTFTLANASTFTGALRDDATGALAIAVNDTAVLNISNSETIKATSLSVASGAALNVVADPLNNTFTQIQTTTATFGAGARVGLTLNSLLTKDTTYTIVQATTLTGTTLGQSLLADSPFLYKLTASINTGANTVELAVARRTATELGFNKSEAAAYDAVFNALLHDAGLEGALLRPRNQADLTTVYDQLLPDLGQGIFAALDSAAQSISSLISDRPNPDRGVGGDSLWLQEVNYHMDRETGATPGSTAKLFGVAGGYESMSPNAGAIGLSLAYLNAQEEDSAAAVGEHVVSQLVEGSLYWRMYLGGLRFSARAGGGYAWFDGTRRFATTGVVREANANWTGQFADAHIGVAYEQRFGRYYVRPELRADYLYLKEGAHSEGGTDSGFNLTVNSRTSDRLSGVAMVTLGAQYGRTTWLRPEFRFGYRQLFSGQMGDTVAQFNYAGSTPFTLLPGDDKGGWVLLGFSLKGGTELSYVSLDGDAEIRNSETRVNVRFSGRAMF